MFAFRLDAASAAFDLREFWTADHWVTRLGGSGSLTAFDYRAANDEIDRRERGGSLGG